MSPSRTTLMALAALLCGCATIGNYVADVPVLNLIFPLPYHRYIDNPLFSFDYPRAWRPAKLADGVEVRKSDTAALISIVYIRRGTPNFKTIDKIRQEMADWGAVEDNHVVETISISSHTAHRARYSKYEYDPEYLLGTRYRVFYAEVIALADTQGVFVIRYVNEKPDFWKRKYRAHYDHFLESLVLAYHEEKPLE